MKYQTVLFDMDGTLLDTLTDMETAVNHILTQYGYPTRTLEEVRRFVGNGAGLLIHRALPQGVDPAREAEVLAAYRAYYQAHNCIRTRPYEGIPELLAALRRAGVRTAVVSNKPDETTRTLAARFFPELDGALGQRDGVAAKPAPDMVQAVLSRLGAEPGQALYVGDSEVDVDTARNAGLAMIGVSWGFRGRAALESAGAPAVADTPAQLLELLRYLEGRMSLRPLIWCGKNSMFLMATHLPWYIAPVLVAVGKRFYTAAAPDVKYFLVMLAEFAALMAIEFVMVWCKDKIKGTITGGGKEKAVSRAIQYL